MFCYLRRIFDIFHEDAVVNLPCATDVSNISIYAFQIALLGTSFTLLQRLGSIARNGAKLSCAKLFAVCTTLSRGDGANQIDRIELYKQTPWNKDNDWTAGAEEIHENE